MGVKEDILRTLQYGKDPYYQAIRNQPSYQAELERVRRDFKERTWIDVSGFIPKFTTEEFEKKRQAYQAKYGNKINIPGFSDVIHIIPKARISAEELAAHNWAKKRGLPSPLSPAQIETLQYRKFRFLKALASPTPTWMKNIGAVQTALDNVEDGLVTVSVLGRIAAKIAPRLTGRLVPGVGWVLLGSDILNALNALSWISFAAKGAKRRIEGLAERNPFHSKAAANRAFRIKRAIPTVGEIIEILQTTDQLFGVGLCLGGIVGMITDAISKVMTYSHQELVKKMPPNPTVDDLTRWAYEGFLSDVEKFKNLLTETYSIFKDTAYRLKQYDEKLRNDLLRFGKEAQGFLVNKIKSAAEKASSWFSNTLIGSMIISTGKDTFLKEDHTKSFIMLNCAIEGLMNWWIENEPLEAFKDIRSFKFKAPSPTDELTIDLLESEGIDWRETCKWPHIEKEYATLEELVFWYAPLIKDSFQTYCLRYSREWEAMIAAQQCVEFTKNILRLFSDDYQVRVGETAYFSMAKEMASQVYLFPPDVQKEHIEAVADYIGRYERKTGLAPEIKDVVRYGESIGIKWMRSFPKIAFTQSAEVFPEWRAIQEQLDDIFVAD